MRGSDPSPDPKQGNIFAAAAVATVLGILSVLAFFNWLANPFGAFDQPLRRSFNDVQSQAFLHADRPLQMRWLKRQGRMAEGKTLLIGTSRVIYGFDTCRRPDVQRLALSSLEIAETAEIVQAALPSARSEATILIELTRSGKTPPPVAETSLPASLHRDLLGWQTTMTSFSNLFASLREADSAQSTPPGCAAKGLQTDLEDAAVTATLAKLRQFEMDAIEKAALRHLLESITPHCRRNNYTVVLFTLPSFFSIQSAPELIGIFDRHAAAAGEIIEFYDSQATGCRFIFQNKASSYIRDNAATGPAAAEWYDATHFKPSLGQRLLEDLSNAAISVDIHRVRREIE